MHSERATEQHPKSERDKDDGIETLRGIAVLLLVAYHCIDVDARPGTFGYAYLGHCFRWLRMPLFTAIAGYVYAMRPIAPHGLVPFLRGKARRLLLPWVNVTILTAIMAFAVGKERTLDGAWRGFIHPIGHLWFIPAICWIFLVVGLLDARGWLASFRAWLGASAIAWIGATFFLEEKPFALSAAIQLLPFFLVGLALRRFAPILLGTRPRIAFGLCALATLTFHQLIWWTGLRAPEPVYNAVFLLSGLSVQALLFHRRRALPLFPRVARYALPIYLYHILAISLGARLVRLAHVDNEHALFAIKLATAVVVPVLIAQSLARFPGLSMLLLGERAGNSAPARPAVAASARPRPALRGLVDSRAT